MESKEKIIARNPLAYHNYEISERYEAGLVLRGNEVKSIRQHAVSLKGSYCLITKGEVFLYNCHISPYFLTANINPERPRKLLLNKTEIKRLVGKVSQRGFSLIPIKLYFKGNLVKLEIGLARSKRKYDKRKEIKEREIKREIQRSLKYGLSF
jgi:SsrA-binding protein